MTNYTTSDRVRIPYRLDSDEYCTYEDEGEESYVRMGDMVTVCYDTVCRDYEYSGELVGVQYDSGGFIYLVALYHGEDVEWVEIPFNDVFYRMEGEHGND